jgi:hypothetical protein
MSISIISFCGEEIEYIDIEEEDYQKLLEIEQQQRQIQEERLQEVLQEELNNWKYVHE